MPKSSVLVRQLMSGRQYVLRLSLFVCFLLVLSSRTTNAQSPPPAGTPETFDVATWNIEWFGDTNSGHGPSDDPRQFNNVRAIIEASNIDIWALQEIANPTAFRRLVDSLGAGYAGRLGDENPYGVSQRLAFIYRTDVVELLLSQHLFAGDPEDSYNFGYRPPMEVRVRVSLPGDTMQVSLITFHGKCCGDTEEWDRRKDGAGQLKGRIDFLRPSDPIILLGDFNDELDSSIHGFTTPSPYAALVADSTDDNHYFAATLHLEESSPELATYCDDASCSNSQGSTLDHIIMTDEVAPYFEMSGRYTAPLEANNRYVYETSDHLPVYARLAFPAGSAISPAGTLPKHLSVAAPFPNPFSGLMTLQYELAAPADVQIGVYDVLGRRVAKLADERRAAGPHMLTFAPSDLPAGMYTIRVTAGSETVVRRVVHL